MFRTWCLAAGLAMTAARAGAESAPDVGDVLRRGEMRQQQLQTRATHAAGRIGGIVEEYFRNSLEGEDAEVLAAVHGALSDLTADEMARVIALLQDARRSPADGARGRLGDAYAVEKSVVGELERILLECRRRLAVHELAARLERLQQRQDANLWSIVALAREAPGVEPERFDERQKTALRLQRTEQAALGRETADALAKMRELAGGEEAAAGAVATALQGAGDAAAVVAAVEPDLAAGRPARAAADAKRARNALRALARAVVPPRDAAEALRRAGQDLDREIERQTRLLAETRPSQMHHYESLALEHRQAEIMDKSDLVQGDVRELAAEAAGLIGEAGDAMLGARVELESPLDAGKNRRVVRNQETALDLLRRARESLQAELAKMQPVHNTVTLQGHGQGLGKTQSGTGRALGKVGRESRPGLGSGTGEGDNGANLGTDPGERGPARDVPGAARVLALPPRDRDVIRQSRTEPYPADYAPLIESYLRSLAGDAGGEPREAGQK